MAQLAQLRLVLDVKVSTTEEIGAYGRLTETIASQLAKEIYRREVEIEVLLVEGSLILRIVVMGSLALGATTYSSLKNEVATLSEEAKIYSSTFVDKFLAQANISDEHVLKISTSTKTPGKIKRLTSKLDKLDAGTPLPAPQVKRELSTAKQVLDSIGGDMTDTEMKHLRTLLEFQHLPPPQNWPSKPKKTPHPTLHKASQPALHKEKSPAKLPSRKPRLRYHNIISVR